MWVYVNTAILSQRTNYYRNNEIAHDLTGPVAYQA